MIELNRFDAKLKSEDYVLLKAPLEILQVNMGKLCNLHCVHCHVEAGPTKTRENMNRETVDAVITLMDCAPIQTLDITGGAPEMNPHFTYLVSEARKRKIHVMDRCNLTVLFEPGQESLAEFLAEQEVEIVASLPCYLQENVDEQRGKGTFDLSVEGLKRLNSLGYGKPQSSKKLNLVYNPTGPHLPPNQEELEKAYRQRLQADHGIEFHNLFTITNMPITRYAKYLQATGAYENYVELLLNSFNASTLDGLMCRNTLSVGWDGKLFDCDFNLALDLPLGNGKPMTIFNFKPESFEGDAILTGEHCFACTAGAGSSCQGALA